MDGPQWNHSSRSQNISPSLCLVKSVGQSYADTVRFEHAAGDAGNSDGSWPELIFVICAGSPMSGEAVIYASAGSEGEVSAVGKAIGEVDFAGTQQDFCVGREVMSTAEGIPRPNEIGILVEVVECVEAKPAAFGLDSEVAQGHPVHEGADSRHVIRSIVSIEIREVSSDGERGRSAAGFRHHLAKKVRRGKKQSGENQAFLEHGVLLQGFLKS